jgi:hypothetical protein
MRRLNWVLAAPVLLGPAALAFAKGGYFDVPRLVAGVVACALVVVVAIFSPQPLPRDRAARAALAGLVALTAWTGLSILWAPIAGAASDDFQRLLLYLFAFVAALAALRPPEVRRYVEPVLLAGIVAAVLYGLSERLLPGVFSLDPLPSADDRLAWPLTYWNAMGALAGIGLVLAASRRSRAAASVAPLLGLACYLTFSRGALGATAAGLAVLVALAPTVEQARSVAVVAGGAILAAAATIAVPAVEAPGGSGAQGAAMIAVLAVLGAAAAALSGPIPASRRISALRAVALGTLALAVVGTAIAVTRVERTGGDGPAQGASPSRLVSAQSNRYEYWRVALNEFTDAPLQGGGSGSFRTDWLRERPIEETVRDAHSLYFETAAELGLIGLAALALFLGGIVAMARRSAQAAGAIAALVTYAVHAGLDWDWELPALTLVALVLAARLAPPAASTARADAPPAAS